jgi:hypothetical protein
MVVWLKINIATVATGPAEAIPPQTSPFSFLAGRGLEVFAVVPISIPDAITSQTWGAILLVGVLVRMLVPVVMDIVVRWVAIFSTEDRRAERALSVLRIRQNGQGGSEPDSPERDS